MDIAPSPTAEATRRPEGLAVFLAKVRHRFFRQVNHSLVDVAPRPALAGFVGSYNGMRRIVGMTHRMLPRGAVAATHVAAGEAEPQMNPCAAGAQALLAALRRARRLGLKSFLMFADHVRTPQCTNAENIDGSPECCGKLFCTVPYETVRAAFVVMDANLAIREAPPCPGTRG